jgi:hypothetical protein
MTLSTAVIGPPPSQLVLIVPHLRGTHLPPPTAAQPKTPNLQSLGVSAQVSK